MNLISVLSTGVLAVAMVTAFSANAASSGNTLRLDFGAYGSNKPSAMVKMLRPLLNELEHSMSDKLQRNVDIRIQIANSYARGISDLVDGSVDFSNVGPASYIEAKRMNPEIEIIAVEQINNSKVSYGVIAVHAQSPVQSLSELQGKSFAFGHEGSSIGRFLSQRELVHAGIRGADLSRYRYLGRHDKVGTAVGANAFDAGALSEKTFKQLVDNGEPIRELIRFPNVSKPWIARSELDDQVLAALRASLLSVQNKSALAALKIDGFMQGDDGDYAQIRDSMENNNAFFEDAGRDVNEPMSGIDSPGETVTPIMQAAVSEITQTTEQVDDKSLNTAVSIAATNSIPTPSVPRSITVQIELPDALFSNGQYSGPDSLVIELDVPEQAR